MFLRPFTLSLLPFVLYRIISPVRGFTTSSVGKITTSSSNNLLFLRSFGGVVSMAAAAAASSSSSTMGEISVGMKLPSGIVMNELTADSPDGKPVPVDITELCQGKKVAIFGVPGAFTPGCSKSHLPSFITAQSDLKAKGIDMTICIATNDAFVMEAWGRTSGGTDAGIRFLSDSAAQFSKELGLAMETPNGIRTKRFSLIANDNVVTHYFNSDTESSNTWAPSVLSAL